MDEENDFDAFELELIGVAQRTLAVLGHLITETDLPKLRAEQEALVVGQLAQTLFGELLAHERAQEDNDDADPNG